MILSSPPLKYYFCCSPNCVFCPSWLVLSLHTGGAEWKWSPLMWKILQTLQLPLPGDGETIINSFFVFWSNLVKLSVPYTVQCSKSYFSAKNEWQFFNCSLDYYPALLHQSHCCSPLIPSHAQHCSEAPVWRPGVDKKLKGNVLDPSSK